MAVPPPVAVLPLQDLGTPAQKDSQKTGVLEMLRAAGVPEARIDEVAHADHQWVIIDYVNGVLSGPRRKLKYPGTPATPLGMNLYRATEEWNLFVNRLNDGFDRPGPDELRSFLDRLGLFDDPTRELIEDYRYYLAKGQHRRPNVWANRGEWQE